MLQLVTDSSVHKKILHLKAEFSDTTFSIVNQQTYLPVHTALPAAAAAKKANGGTHNNV